jgi:hypothetical protein
VTTPTLQEAQTNALLSLLNLNSVSDSTTTTTTTTAPATKPAAPAGPPVWKILVLDHQTQDVLATVLRVQDIRDVGVTLHVCVFSIILPNLHAHSTCASALVSYIRPDLHCRMYPLYTLSLPPLQIFSG